MLTSLTQFLVAGLIVVAGGVGLAYSADAIARITGLGRVLVGSVLVAAATSLPDLVVGVSAARNGWPDLIVGDLLGAALINLLILAILDLTHVSRGRMLSRQGAAHALSGAMCVSLMALVGLSLVVTPRVDASLAGIDVTLWGVVAAYALGVRLIYFDQRVAGRTGDDADAPGTGEPGLRRWALIFLVSAAAIIAAAPVLTHAADDLAERTGLGNTFFGTVFVPLSTTLPELAVGVTAIRLRAFPLVVGNAFGSIAFNLMLLAPLDMAYDGSLMAAASPTHLITCFAAILTTAVAVMGQLYHAERRIRFLEPDALLIIVLVFTALAVLYYLR